jgi:endonuclease YncB( thermonuclease family)
MSDGIRLLGAFLVGFGCGILLAVWLAAAGQERPSRQAERLDLGALPLAVDTRFLRIPAEEGLGEPIPPELQVRITDGDTLRIGDERVRLWGIDAPEADQWCIDAAGAEYPCGLAARAVLEALLAARPEVICAELDVDRNGRSVARCLAGGADLAAAMVEAGHALDWERYSQGAYAEHQRHAQAAGRGLWAGTFIPPWEWRRL